MFMLLVIYIIIQLWVFTALNKNENDYEMNNIIQAEALSLLDPDAEECTKILEGFRADEIKVITIQGENKFYRLFATVTNTNKPFYVAIQDEKIDNICSKIMKNQLYYEKQLTYGTSFLNI